MKRGVDVDPDPDPVGSALFCRIRIGIGIEGLPIRIWIQYPAGASVVDHGSASFCRIRIRIGIQGLPIRTWIQYPDLFSFQPNLKNYIFSRKYKYTLQKLL
jgi:hypothetical protein